MRKSITVVTIQATSIHVLLHLNEKGRVWADIVICTTIDYHQDPPPFSKGYESKYVRTLQRNAPDDCQSAHGVVVVDHERVMTRCWQ